MRLLPKNVVFLVIGDVFLHTQITDTAVHECKTPANIVIK